MPHLQRRAIDSSTQLKIFVFCWTYSWWEHAFYCHFDEVAVITNIGKSAQLIFMQCNIALHVTYLANPVLVGITCYIHGHSDQV